MLALCVIVNGMLTSLLINVKRRDRSNPMHHHECLDFSSRHHTCFCCICQLLHDLYESRNGSVDYVLVV